MYLGKLIVENCQWVIQIKKFTCFRDFCLSESVPADESVACASGLHQRHSPARPNISFSQACGQNDETHLQKIY